MSMNEMEYRGWRFRESKLLIPREVQWKVYFDNKFADIDIDKEEIRQVMDEALEEDLEPKFAAVNEHIDEVHEHIEQDITEAKDDIEENVEAGITEAKDEIIEKIGSVDVEPIVTAAKIEIEEKIEEAKDHLCCDICCAKNAIIEHIDEKLSDLNQQVIDDDNNG